MSSGAGFGLDRTMASDAQPDVFADAQPIVAGYDLLRILGRGAMGIVWEAVERRLERRVALKVQAASAHGTDEEMWSEARFAARVAHPGIVPVHDMGHTLDGRPYYTMDLVAGTDLAALMREGPVPAARALAIMRQVAEAVGAAHEHGVLHRDLKPTNVVIDGSGNARVLDFGLAVGITRGSAYQSEHAVGTPAYMAPEQAAGEPLAFATDVYALGVILYELLSGHLPITASNVVQLMERILTTEPTPLRAHLPAVDAAVERFCMRCLAKEPQGRPENARAAARAIAALLEGRSIDDTPERAPMSRELAPRPMIDAARDAAKLHERWSWTMRASPEALWPHVADTDRFNRAVGLPSVEEQQSPDAGIVRVAAYRVLGMDVVWRERPFEWIRGRTHGVHRVYEKGPFAAMWSRVELHPREDGGTELVHEVWANPIGATGRVAAWFEIRFKAARRIAEVYRRLDAFVASRAHVDPFEEPYRPDDIQQRYIDERVCRLEPAIGERLRNLLLYAPSKVLERLRAHRLAAQWGISRDQALDTLLQATALGLLDVAWDLVCPACGIAHEVQARLRDVNARGSCSACKTTYARDLARSVELLFRPHAEVRRVETSTYCLGSPALQPHVVMQQVLAPRESRSLVIGLSPGDYLIARRTPQVAPRTLSASRAGVATNARVSVAEGRADTTPGVVRAGAVMLTLENETDQEQLVRLERLGDEDAVTAAVALTHPLFNALLGDQLVSHGQHLSASRMSFVVVDLADRGAVFAAGDGAALEKLTELRELAATCADAERGAVVDDSFAPAILAFPDVAPALRAAVRLVRDVDGAKIRAGVHEGRCLVIERRGAPEYVGETLERTRALLDDCPPNAVVISTAVEDHIGAAEILHGGGVRSEVAKSTSPAYPGRRIVRVRPV